MPSKFRVPPPFEHKECGEDELDMSSSSPACFHRSTSTPGCATYNQTTDSAYLSGGLHLPAYPMPALTLRLNSDSHPLPPSRLPASYADRSGPCHHQADPNALLWQDDFRIAQKLGELLPYAANTSMPREGLARKK